MKYSKLFNLFGSSLAAAALLQCGLVACSEKPAEKEDAGPASEESTQVISTETVEATAEESGKELVGVADQRIRQFHYAMDLYKLANYKYPDSLEALTEPDQITGEPILSAIPLDPWQNEYVFELAADGKPVIICYGEDGKEAGEGFNKDITSITIGL